MSEKIDLFKQYKDEYKAGSKPALIKTTASEYLCIEGKGVPGEKDFDQAIGALYSMAFTIKMTRKAQGLGDYVVCKLEAVWWSDEDVCFSKLPKEKWQWKMMIRTPGCVGRDDLEKACKAIIAKGKSDAVKRVHLEELHEGRCVQALHVGPYDKVERTIKVMSEYMDDNGLSVSGKYHEIYLSDPRRVEPDRLKTIVRLPVNKT